jgi:hypothetical protein
MPDLVGPGHPEYGVRTASVKVEEMIRMTPTPETHTFEGMWRPPWETIRFAECPACGPIPKSTTMWPEPGRQTHRCWLAGHFDTPIYREKDGTRKRCGACNGSGMVAAEPKKPPTIRVHARTKAGHDFYDESYRLYNFDPRRTLSIHLADRNGLHAEIQHSPEEPMIHTIIYHKGDVITVEFPMPPACQPPAP